MSRRSIKSISSKFDLSGVFCTYSELPESFDMELLFGRVAPIELEIGSGKGRFLRRAADDFTEHNFIGIEVSSKYAKLAASRLLNRSCKNAIVICCDAAKLLIEWIPDNILHSVHVYFPDPWWKRAHRKRRILRKDVLQLIEQRLIPNGILYFRTDVEEYFQSTLDLISKNIKLLELFDVNISDNLPNEETDYNTHFERRTIIKGEKVFRAKFRKNIQSNLEAPSVS
ncbi:MAG: tRNA (guanosine(46)-N7)-methyltransferase TrmB [Planctomycetaceae bacterium]|jgi:tRNA (guanine-N7-)-methyltransferase|nr:tRNA (guanosine(46)-N7)-methyltransferase TrmB [Planctomycetaceae bacterium]